MSIACGAGEGRDKGGKEVKSLGADKVQGTAHFQCHQRGCGEAPPDDFIDDTIDSLPLGLGRFGRTGRIDGKSVFKPLHGGTSLIPLRKK